MLRARGFELKKQKPPYNGVLAIDKPTGMTSFDVIRRVKKILNMKKVGHGGTLDKAASGVLPILLGEATKLFDYLLVGRKEYIATVQFGAFTDTDDAEGSVIETQEFQFDKEAILRLLPRFTGEIEQVPPQYSALKINGQRSYDLARREIKVEHRPRKVTIYGIFPEHFEDQKSEAVLRIRCSSGTYIRSIARDLGKLLGWGAHLSALRRTQSAGLALEDCLALDHLDPKIASDHLIPFNQALSDYPELKLAVSPDYLRQGKKLDLTCFQNQPEKSGVYRATQNHELVALVEYKKEKLKYRRVFAPVEEK